MFATSKSLWREDDMTDVPERFRLWLKRTPDGKFIPTKLSNERAAVEAVLGTGACSVTWLESVRRGESGEEPDWVSTDPAGVIVAGFEVTEPAFTASRLVNAKLAEWLAGQAPPPDRARMPSHEHAELSITHMSLRDGRAQRDVGQA